MTRYPAFFSNKRRIIRTSWGVGAGAGIVAAVSMITPGAATADTSPVPQPLISSALTVKIRSVAQSDYCLESFDQPGVSSTVKVTRCESNASTQQWHLFGYYGLDGQYSVLENVGNHKCLDLPFAQWGDRNNLKFQVWDCSRQ